MSFDRPRRHGAPTLDASRTDSSGRSEDEALLGKIAAELESLGERATIRRTGSGQPFLSAFGAITRFNEEITTVRRDGQIRAMWAWDEELPADPREAAAAIRRVINPAA
ncbi:hypothetical protein [Actinomadura rubrisoli]|uniref:Uncharacterized protein n=1 Tax=Actinomadura rubrisoli TaxID=2530368 RepID=A0A4R5CCE5_9ACTN|nr:hypothetical protein [Actinomadura rubrisoli]TDD94792.1 hypothetical protein E1298_06395 [Actinomadura rubrisoli]